MRISISTLMLFSLALSSALAQPTTVVINEFMADNETTITDPSGTFEDWIEIYNYGNDPVDIAGLYITDDLTIPDKYQIPSGNDSTIIQAKSYLLLWADNDIEEGVLHLDIKLSKNGEQIGIVKSDGNTFIDSLTFGPQSSDISFGRVTDGSVSWIFFNDPTPGRANGATSIVEHRRYTLNINPNPATDVTYIEMPFTGTKTISLYDIAGNEIKSVRAVGDRYTMYLDDQVKGQYILTVRCENKLYSSKLIIN